MGKIAENKEHKLNNLLTTAYNLFVTRGIERTAISDIVKGAGVAKGTFYLYFKDKYDIRDRLIAHTSNKLFVDSLRALNQQDISEFEDKIIFIVDYLLERLSQNHSLLKFISKNLSWGVFKQAVTSKTSKDEVNCFNLYHLILTENPNIKVKDPEIMLFMIIELASSTCYSTILYNDPISFEELKPYLNESIRMILKSHLIQ